MAEHKRSDFFYGWVIIIATFWLAVVIAGIYRTFGVFFQPMTKELGWTRAATAGAFSLGGILSGVFAITAGRLTDRFGPRVVMTTAGILFGTGYLLMAKISEIWQLYLVFGGLIGTAMAAAAAPSESTIARWFAIKRGTMMGIFQAGAGLGIMLVIPLSGWLITTYTWRTSYTILGITAIAFIVFISQFLRRDPAQMKQLPYEGNNVRQSEEPSLPTREFTLRQAVRTSQFWMLSIISLSLTFVMQTIYVHIVPHSISFGVAATTAANTLVIIGASGIIGRLSGGLMYDKLGSKPSYIICFGFLTLAFLWLTIAQTVWMLYLFAAAFGLAYSGLIVLRAPLLAELFGLSSIGVIMGSVGMAGNVGGVVGPVLAGYIYDLTGSYQIAFLVAAALCAVGIIIILFLKPIKDDEIPRTK